MNSNMTELVFVLDRSGSMTGLESDTIGGFNSVIEKQKKCDGEALVSTVLFDNRIEVLHDRVRLENVPTMTEQEYFTRGCTALLDAVGGAIHHISTVHRYARSEDVPEKAMFVIITDGLENASRSYSYPEVKRMIEHEQEKYGWEFVFLGANIDAAAEAGRIGIRAERAARYNNDAVGLELCYSAVDEVVTNVRMRRASTADWKRDVESDCNKRNK